MFMVEWEFTYLMTSVNKEEHMVSKVIWGSVAWPAQKKLGVRTIFLCWWAVKVRIYIHGTPLIQKTFQRNCANLKRGLNMSKKVRTHSFPYGDATAKVWGLVLVRSLKVSEQILNFMYNWIGSEWSLLIVCSLGDCQSWKAGLEPCFKHVEVCWASIMRCEKVVSYISPGTTAAAIDITMSSVEDCFMCLNVLKWKMQSWHGGVCWNSS